MTCLVFSDSHGDSRNMISAIEKNRDAEVVFFLGDGILDLEEIAPRYPNIAFYAALGNCDRINKFRGSAVKHTDFINILGVKIAFTHGHLYGVKSGRGGIISLGLESLSDVVLFGHTHTAEEKYISGERPFYLFNPGSISGYESSFGIVKITDKGILLSHGKIHSRQV